MGVERLLQERLQLVVLRLQSPSLGVELRELVGDDLELSVDLGGSRLQLVLTSAGELRSLMRRRHGEGQVADRTDRRDGCRVGRSGRA